ncbi:MarR family winged helix-turn-helix transcriptional regulator [Chelativorans alearense]|uniref:MarR family winged helix-turn-helix transcriptional regulator n=1 Tax=Chelativorans alearense TaxID=2681495 RepID=UPI0013D45BAB|nr:MarR family winged helix-turn-helix transcriptional regulator [Chelativorans alearense]
MTLPAGQSDKPCEGNRSLSEAPFEAPGGEAELPCITSLLDFKLRRAQLLVFHDFATTLAKLKLRPAEFSVLAMIAKYPGQKQTTIAEGLGIKRANFVFLMDSIEARGLAERRKGRADRRSHSLYLTEEGKRYVDRMTALWHEHENRMIGRLGGRENLERLTELLDRLLGTSAGGGNPMLTDPH